VIVFNAHELAAIAAAKPLADAARKCTAKCIRYEGGVADDILGVYGIDLGYRRGPIRYHHVVSAVCKRQRQRKGPRNVKHLPPKACQRCGETFHRKSFGAGRESWRMFDARRCCSIQCANALRFAS